LESSLEVFDRRPALGATPAEDCRLVWSNEGQSLQTPALTIAIPTFQRPGLLKEALISACNQSTQCDFEVVVVDNDASCSHDVQDVVRAASNLYPNVSVRLFRNDSNVGMFGNWNRCLSAARGSWVSILNDDDLIYPGFVEAAGKLVETQPEACAFFFGYRVHDARQPHTPLSLDPHAETIDVNQILKLSALQLCLGNDRAGSLGIVYRTDKARRIGGFDASDFPTADYRFNCRLLYHFPRAFVIDSEAAIYRIQDNESLKPSVLAAFVDSDFRMRMEASRILPCRNLLRAYARVAATVQRHTLQRVWGVQIPLKSLPEADHRPVAVNRLGLFSARVKTRVIRWLILRHLSQ
jgi:glycosyltransferase